MWLGASLWLGPYRMVGWVIYHNWLILIFSLVHGLLRIIRRRYFPRKIALCKSLTQVRDRRLGYKKLNKSKNSSNLDILIPSKFDDFVVSSI